MKNNIKKKLIFILYSWCIYNMFVFTTTPFYMKDKGFILSLTYGLCALSGYLPIVTFFGGLGIILTSLFLPFMICVLAGFISFFLWCRKQTIIRAWLLADVGMLLGPGIPFFYYQIWLERRSDASPYGALSLNLLFLILFIGNYLQKSIWPDNRIMNKISYILKWPCLNT